MVFSDNQPLNSDSVGYGRAGSSSPKPMIGVKFDDFATLSKEQMIRFIKLIFNRYK
jgi:hypothetical protein